MSVIRVVVLEFVSLNEQGPTKVARAHFPRRCFTAKGTGRMADRELRDSQEADSVD